MAIICFFVFILVQLTQSAFSLKYDMEDTICNLCKQRKVCKPGTTPSPHPVKGRVLFSASFSGHTYVNPGQKFVLDKVTMDIGGLYHKDVGIFISDRDDVFLFNWSIYKMAGTFFSVHLMLDGNVKASSFSGITGYETLSGSFALPLTKGSKVWLQCGQHKQGRVNAGTFAYFSAVSL
uniref:C1qDC protein n=1 Tax=Pinctada fucata TaxID=50426 RepID=A0A7L7S6E5_PINFU|nr:C1qDC protein [Pinctada fucata]